MPEKLTDQPVPALQAALLGRYLLDHELGRGGMGMGEVGRDLALERPVDAADRLGATVNALETLRLELSAGWWGWPHGEPRRPPSAHRSD